MAVKVNEYLDGLNADIVKTSRAFVNYFNDLLTRTEHAKSAVAMYAVQNHNDRAMAVAKALDARSDRLRSVTRELLEDSAFTPEVIKDLQTKFPNLLVSDSVIVFDEPIGDNQPTLTPLPRTAAT